MTKNNKYILAFFSCLALALASIHTASALDVGSNEISNTIQLTTDNPIKIAARIINFFMMFLGIIAVSLVIFAGFKWMTSNGNEENIDAAKKILKNAVIGLVIILSSWGIVTFILGRLIGDTGSGGTSGGGTKYGVLAGGGALGTCTIQSVYPEPEQKEVPRNTAIIITFKEDLKLDTVCLDAGGAACACDNTTACNRLNKNYFKIYEGAGLPGDATSTDAIVNHPVGDNKTLVITPVLPLGSPANNTWYTTYISNDVQATTGCPNGAASCGMFDTCATDYYRWQFEVSNKLDLTPPQMVLGGIFPDPDNIRDVITTNSVLASAVGSFKVNDTPKAYVPAQVQSIISQTANSQPATIALEANYNETVETEFSITVILGDKAQLQKGTTVLGVTDFNGNSVTFPGYFTLTVGGDETHTVGNMWLATISAAQRADTIMVGADTYNFVSGAGSGYNIEIDSNPTQQAVNIAAALSSRTDVLASANSITVNIESKAGGFAGNSINLSTNNYTTFTIVAMHGGTDSAQVAIVKDKKDKPMNSIIQINFNEAVNPITVSGSAGEVKDTIRIVNNDSAAKTNGQSCTQNNDC
ncbi:MAG: pilin, partial [Candidatus Falkowbacteria bacterium]